MSNYNPNRNGPGSWARSGQIYKAELAGTPVGKFGHAGKLAPGIQVVHMMACRNPNQNVVRAIESCRMQKYVLKGSKYDESLRIPSPCRRGRDRFSGRRAGTRLHQLPAPD